MTVLGVGAGALALSASARAEITWTMSGNTDCGTSCSSSMGNSMTFSGGSGNPTVTATAWSNTGTLTTSTNSLTGTLEAAFLGAYSGGLGVKNADGGSTSPNIGDSSEWVAPEHAVDNQSRYDSVLFKFSSAIDLNKVTVGYISGDSDITVLAYTGAGTPTVAGKTYTNLLTQSWTLVGNYSNLALNTATAVNAGNIASQYWLIATAIPGLGGTTLDSTYDYVKLLALYGDKPPGKVPEPNAALLLGLALAGVWVTRRRRAVQVR